MAHREDDHPPPEESWFAGRRWVGLISAVLACAWVALLAVDLAAGDVDTTWDRVYIAIRCGLIVAFTYQAVYELRSRVAVDGDGVHRDHGLRRRTYRWQDITEVRPGRATWGEPHLELIRRDGAPVPLPRSTGYLHVLRGWHAAATRSPEV